MAALVLFLATVVITMAVHVPLNDAIKSAGDADQIDEGMVRRQVFNESKWATWNHVRTVSSLEAFLILAAVLAG